MTVKRGLASVVLAVVVLSFVTPPLGGGATRECPLAPGGGGPVLVAGMDGSACEHTDVGPCLAALGCVTAAPAIRPAAALLTIPTRLIVLAAAPTPHVGDLYRTGPPTPPPNHI
jgi:hypothetical protein